MTTASSLRPSPAAGSLFRSFVLLFVGAVVLALSTFQSAFAADPNLVLDRIRKSGELRVPVMIGEEPGYIRDRNTGAWSGFYLSVPLFTDAWAIVTKPGFTKKTWAELNDPSVRIVVQKGGTMQVVAEALTPKANIIVVEDRPLGIMELQANRADAMILAVFDAIDVSKAINGQIVLPSPMLLNPATIGMRREEGNEGYENWLTNWVNQQRALGLAQGKLRKAFEARGIDLSVLPAEFNF